MASNGVVPEPKAEIRKSIDGGKKLTSEIAKHLWTQGWSSELASRHYHWPLFLRFIKARFFRIQTWAAGDWTWEEALDKLRKDIVDWEPPDDKG